jgi:hypothetical protein
MSGKLINAISMYRRVVYGDVARRRAAPWGGETVDSILTQSTCAQSGCRIESRGDQSYASCARHIGACERPQDKTRGCPRDEASFKHHRLSEVTVASLCHARCRVTRRGAWITSDISCRSERTAPASRYVSTTYAHSLLGHKPKDTLECE